MHVFPAATRLRRRHVLMLTGAATLAACAPHAHGHHAPAPDMRAVDSRLRQAVTRGEAPGVVCAIGHDRQVVHRAVYGRRAVTPTAQAMTWDTVFDMASLTKPTITAPAVMQLWERGLFGLDDPVARYLPQFAAAGKAGITIRHLLTHYSGLPPDLDLAHAWQGRNTAFRLTMETAPTQPPGSGFIYSDINFITLGFLVEKLSGLTLDAYARRFILTPLGMRQSGFLPPDEWSARIAPTQPDENGHMLRGQVHDPSARRMGGVAGHAGLFSTAQDMCVYAQALLDRRAGRPSTYPLQARTLMLMTTAQQPRGGSDLRGLGWDIATHYSSPRGDRFPVGSFGHTGFTGTSLWLDPGSDSYVLILTSRLHPDGHGNVVRLRHDVATAAALALLGPAGG
ncbi:serine hydrolase domain-containing protein [Komagataeibacter rhaeticus]|uniref:Beta-lactamase family protein n=1 Tax=Komagataeibacter rhaeticus TaxID=215221 RepID=A0A181CA32_9PROT|nr:serine hydrolase domain-containing protein [Komagataeibacter rhaeticus]ATU73050.1 serine hydrolase [Komagataeibacter xylinus]QIP35205.1 beta-lactamase family protein [Komagataeibacter rhaeticus]QOC47768.1 beta-lactamase family protein [Komagataeibacter rhaeticus]WPP22868.1 serine hydrolase domain-containing protein [Komagataeibacter rhaeticus]SAY48398.1 Penicillin-binding protein 4* [Komagataeibacter rhaeticus]